MFEYDFDQADGNDDKDARKRLEDVYACHARVVWAAAYAVHPATAMESTQEAFVLLWRLWQQGEEVADPVSWLRQGACEEARKRSAINGAHPAQQGSGELVGESFDPRSFGVIREALSGFSSQDRQMLTLRYALDYDSDEIARLLGLNAVEVHGRLSRLRLSLAEHLKALGFATQANGTTE